MTTITITRTLPVINGFVRVPNVDQRALTKVLPTDVTASIAGTDEVKMVRQNFVAFPAFDRELDWPTDDWYGTVRALALV